MNTVGGRSVAAKAGRYRAALAHVRLNVRDVQRAVEFYTNVVGLELIERGGDGYAFVSRGRAHHMVALFTADVTAPPGTSGPPGVDHIAFEVRGARAFTRAFQTLAAAGVPVTTVNNGISWSIYFQDPDGNHLEIFRDMRRERGGQKYWRGVRKPLREERILAPLGRATARRRAQPAGDRPATR
jgi:catechol 2,3-dioxygenase